MKKLLWRLYYLAVQPKTKSEIAIRYCRLNNKPYVNIKCPIVKDSID